MSDVQQVGIKEIVALLADRIEDVCKQYLPNGTREGSIWRVGSLAGEPGRSLLVHLWGEKRGRWSDMASGEHGDALDLIGGVLSCDKARALAEARDFLHLPRFIERNELRARQQMAATRRHNEQFVENEVQRKKQEAVTRIWRQARPIKGTPGEAYFTGRGIDADIVTPFLRFHDDLWHQADGKRGHAAVICPVAEGNDTLIRAIWRIYIQPDGAGGWKKTTLAPARLGLGHCPGGAVRLNNDGDTLFVTEGVETGMAALQAFRRAGLRHTVWAARATSGIRGLIVPERFRRIVLAEENDPVNERGQRPGPDAVAAKAAELAGQGRDVYRVPVPEGRGKDINDWLRIGPAPVAANAIRQAVPG